MIGWALKFLGGWQGYAVAAAAAFLLGATGAGVTVSKIKNGEIAELKLEHTKAIVKAQVAAMKYQADADKITHDLDVKDAEARQKIVEKTVTIIRKVPKYVTPETDARFPLPCGFIRLHDAATSGADPATIPLGPGESDAAPCSTKASEAAAIIAWNYGQALSWRSSLMSWQDWYRLQKDLAGEGR